MEVLANNTKNKILRIGRRAGKTELIIRLSVAKALENPKQNIAILSLNYNQAKNVIFKRFEDVAHESWELRSGDSLQVRFPNGSIIYIISGEQPDSIRGYGFHFAFIDEAAYLQPDLWTKIIKPALLTTGGGAFICSTPKGMNWFYTLWETVADNDEWARFHLPSSASELISADDIEEQRQQLSEQEFREEILAEFINNAGAVFRNVNACAVITVRDTPENHKGHTFSMGVDWGRSHDYTVLTVMCIECRSVVDWDRFNKSDYIYQRERLKTLYQKWNVYYVLAESNSIGQPNIEMLWQDGIAVRGFAMTAQSKPPLIRQLVLAIEKAEIKIPAEYIGELNAYTASIDNNGRAKYSAPNGLFDDRVISLALADKSRRIGNGFGMVMV